MTPTERLLVTLLTVLAVLLLLILAAVVVGDVLAVRILRDLFT